MHRITSTTPSPLASQRLHEQTIMGVMNEAPEPDFTNACLAIIIKIYASIKY